MAMQPDRNADVSDPSTWASYEAALDAVETRRADGITYMLTKDDPFAAIDVDHCRDVRHPASTLGAEHSRRRPEQLHRNNAVRHGLRIWGLASGDKVHRKFTLEIDGKLVAAELFRRTNKALTITGLTLNPAITSSPTSTR